MWTRDALTAKRATALQAFRDLFTEEILRPGDDVEIDNITIMFTDLKGSTAIGLHSGRCISVTLNGRLDYYGTAAPPRGAVIIAVSFAHSLIRSFADSVHQNLEEA